MLGSYRIGLDSDVFVETCLGMEWGVITETVSLLKPSERGRLEFIVSTLVIGETKGVLMHKYGLSKEEADEKINYTLKRPGFVKIKYNHEKCEKESELLVSLYLNKYDGGKEEIEKDARIVIHYKNENAVRILSYNRKHFDRLMKLAGMTVF